MEVCVKQQQHKQKEDKSITAKLSKDSQQNKLQQQTPGNILTSTTTESDPGAAAAAARVKHRNMNNIRNQRPHL